MELIILFIVYSLIKGVVESSQAKQKSKGGSPGKTVLVEHSSEERKQQEIELKKALEKVQKKFQEVKDTMENPTAFPNNPIPRPTTIEMMDEFEDELEDEVEEWIEEPKVKPFIPEKQPEERRPLTPLCSTLKHKQECLSVEKEKENMPAKGVGRRATVVQGVIWSEVLGTPRGKVNYWQAKNR